MVDVLSFTTCVSIAAERGIEVYPCRWQDHAAAQYAERVGAVLAVGRGVPGGLSLSPASIAGARGVDRLVLPSPNGSTVALSLAESGTIVVAGALRNRRAVAQWVAQGLSGDDGVAVVAAGERWPDGSLRPALEDLWGAGAVLAALGPVLDRVTVSPEAAHAASSYDLVAGRLPAALLDCASGSELDAAGFRDDVSAASAVDSERVVPLLGPEGFAAADGGYHR